MDSNIANDSNLANLAAKVLKGENEISFDDFLNLLNKKYVEFCFKKNGDMVIILGGSEGSGKSLLGLAVGSKNDKKFKGEHVYYGGGEYSLAILGAYKQKTKRWSPEQLEKYNKKLTIIDIPDDKIDKTINKGTNLLYDEGSQGLFNRRSMDPDQIDQVTIFTINRVLNLCHIICIPDPSTLEKYIKKFRVKIFIWVQEIGGRRMAYMWNRKSFIRMSLRRDFEDIVNGGIEKMSKCSWPNFCCEIPVLVNETKDENGFIGYESTGYISAGVLEYYHINKDFEGMDAVSNMNILKKHVDGNGKPPKKGHV